MTMQLTYGDEYSTVQWKSPAAGLWVVSDRDMYLGMVERSRGRYIASDPTGRDVGAFETLGDAQMALDGRSREPLSSPRDILLMKAIMAMTGITALALAIGLVLRWT